MIYLLILLSSIMLLLLVRQHKTRPVSEKFAVNDALLNHVELMKHAVSIAQNHVISKRAGSYPFLFSRLHDNYRYIMTVYKELNANVRSGMPLCPASEWLLDNFYVIEEQYKDLSLNIAEEYYDGLRILMGGPFHGYPRIFSIGLELVSHTDGRIDRQLLIDFLEAYQSVSPLTMSEIWSLSSMLKFCTMEKVRSICEKIQNNQTERERLHNLMQLPQSEFLQNVEDEMRSMKELNVSFTEQLLTTLRREDFSCEQLLQLIDTRLVEFDTSVDAVINLEHQQQANLQITIGNCITSLRHVNTIDWEEIFEQVSMVEKILGTDPSNLYKLQDFETRDYYRHQVEALSIKYGFSETMVARKAISCASSAAKKDATNAANSHIGYYLISEGQSLLLEQLGIKPPKKFKVETRSHLYIISILLLSTLLSCACVVLLFGWQKHLNAFVVASMILILWIPSSEIVISLLGRLITGILPPSFLPKLEWKEGIPKNCSTLVALPTLLSGTQRVSDLLSQLERLYLSNNEANISFALVGDLKDHSSASAPEDTSIIDLALSKIAMLNQKYENKFYFLLRERRYNASCGCWMGWERKRGAILELNNLIKGSEDTSYNIISDNLESLQSVRYVITLDADSILPIDAARKLIGTISHPLNQGILDETNRIVKKGYGIIQPRIGMSIQSTNMSMFSRIFAGRGGVDSYSSAVSDVYQDLFGEGIYTGKGIYDVSLFSSLLNDTIAENTVLSHDLLEGSFLRTGLATDIEVIDNYPGKYSSYMLRLHRWVRGDWQILRWLFPRVMNKAGHKIENPLSLLSKWKIFDNLRRSLVSVSLMLTFLASLMLSNLQLLILSVFALIVIFLPLILGFWEQLRSSGLRGFRLFGIGNRLNGDLVCGAKSMFYETLISFVLLPYHAYMMSDAILRTVYRTFLSHRNMLEWVTAADAEKTTANSFRGYFSRIAPSLLITFALCIAGVLYSGRLLPITLLLVVIWSCAPIVAYWISTPTVRETPSVSAEADAVFHRIARKTWHFYQSFSREEDHFLPPDNFQLLPVRRTAHRTSPTNIGLLMVSAAAAHDMGYLTRRRLVEYITNILNTVERLDKWNGHLLNWYDTQTLEVLSPRYVSTVDSGNLIGYLITLRAALEESLSQPFSIMVQVNGMLDTIKLFAPSSPHLMRVEQFIASPKEEATLHTWISILSEILDYAQSNSGNADTSELFSEAASNLEEISMLFPLALVPDNDLEVIQKSRFKNQYNQLLEHIQDSSPIHILETLKGFYEELESFIAANSKQKHLQAFLDLRLHIQRTLERLNTLLDSTKRTNDRITALIDATSFAELYDRKTGLFSIGYNLESDCLTNSYYDLLASEARITSFIAVARREIPVSHWFKLGRSLASIEGYKALVSWTGTMFEYFMPALVMQTYPNTLLAETNWTVLRAQLSYGRRRKVPWGTSESGFHLFDLLLNYQYKAFGVPELGLKRGLVNDMVVSPYSTLLCLLLSPKDCAENLNSLISEGLEGDYGLYEAVDYTPERIPEKQSSAIVQSFMAHHQGMIMLSLTNYFNNGTMIRRFHSHPSIKAAEYLLQERIPDRIIITKEHKEPVAPLEKAFSKTPIVIRSIKTMDTAVPQCHVLSNNSYVLLTTSKGQSFSRKDELFLTRWREGLSPESGFFILAKNIESNTVWSPTFAPICEKSMSYEARFSPDKAEFITKHQSLESHLQICVSPEDNCEIRKLTLTNTSSRDLTVELTSYSEVVLASLMADMAHPGFNSLFIRTEAVIDSAGLIASKRSREDGTTIAHSFHSISLGTDAASFEGYETDRCKFLGRSKNISTAESLSHPLSNTAGSVLDPIFSLRGKLMIPAGKSGTIAFILGYADSRNSALELISKYKEKSNINRAFELSYIRSQMSSKFLNLKNREVKLFDNMLSHLFYISQLKRINTLEIPQNKNPQSDLWSYGVSGDLPIILVEINHIDNIDRVRTMVKGHEYFRTKGIRSDLVILCNDAEDGYIEPLHSLIRDVVLSNTSMHVLDSSGGIFIRNIREMQQDHILLFRSTARIAINASSGSVSRQLQLSEDQVQSLVQNKSYENGCSSAFDTTPDPYVSWSGSQLGDRGEPLLYFNGTGGFHPQTHDYVIRLSKDQQTPAPWSNVISSRNFGFLETESGAGCTWSLNSRENKLTPWSNDMVSNPPSEVIYLKDNQDGNFWSITPLPVRDAGEYTTTHGKGYTRHTHNSNGLIQEMTVFTPASGERLKISLVKLVNLTNQPRNLSIYYYAKPVLGSNEQLTQQHISTGLLNGTDILIAQNGYSTDFSNCFMFMDSSLKKQSYTADQQEFLGNCGNLACPEALKKDSLSCITGSGFYPCLAMQSGATLLPHQELVISFLLGESSSREEIRSLSIKYRSIPECVATLEYTTACWKNLLNRIQIETPDPSMDIMMNSWLLYQTVSCRLWGRTAFYQSGGAYGFRDQLQDVLSLLSTAPDLAKEQILLHCAHQFVEGDVQHWWHPYAGNKGIRTRFSDDLLWLPYTVSEYVSVTGDTSLLSLEAPYLEAPSLKDNEDEHYSTPSNSTQSSSVYDHCIRAIELALRFGEHGIPLMGSGDWNDGMNTVGNKGQGESVWMGWFLCSVLDRFSSVCDFFSDHNTVVRYQKIAREIADHIEANAWDGNWYRRAYFDDGTPLGSAQNEECQIDSLSQSWAAISGYGDVSRTKQALTSLDQRLVLNKDGLILLFEPPFDHGDLKPGYIKGYVPGVRENGGQYTHAAIWVVSAFATIGDGDKAYDCFRLLNPINHSSNPADCGRYKVEPYVLAADVYHVDIHNGRGGWTWYTGSSSWMYKVGLEKILGFTKRGDTLTFNPCIPRNWPYFKLNYDYGQCIFQIHLQNPRGTGFGVSRMAINGIPIPDLIIRLNQYSGICTVDIELS